MPPGQFGAPPPKPPRLGILSSPSAIRAALLNLSGLGAGYVYLRQWIFFGVALAVTIGLLVTAGVLGAADDLLIWVPVILVWFLAAAVHGLFAGRARDERTLSRGETPAKGRLPMVAAAGLVLALTVSFLGVWQTGEWRLRVADAAHANGDCATATSGYEQVEGGFQLSLSPSLMARARAGTEACRILTRAQSEVDSEEYDRALDTYSSYFAHPASRWEDTDGEVADTYLVYAGSIADAASDAYTGVVTDEIREDLQRAHEIYSVIPVDYDGTAAAGQVPGALLDLYDTGTSDYAEELWCAAFNQIDVFIGLDWEAAPEVAERIDAEAPDAALKCGWAEVEDGTADTAEAMTDFLTAEYPDHEADDVEDLVRHVGAAHIGERMDGLTDRGDVDFNAAPTGSVSGDQVVMEIVNDSQYEMLFLYVGPDGAHDEISTPGCEDCGEYSSPPAGNSCFSRGGETMRVELEPGEYRLLLTREDGPLSLPLHGTLDLSAGDEYRSCFYLMEP